MNNMNNMNGSQNSSRSNSNSSGNCSRKSRLQQFKNEVASSINVDLKPGYNGDLTSREAGSVGGEMVRRMIRYAEDSLDNSNGSN